jgi:hypothetical protein
MTDDLYGGLPPHEHVDTSLAAAVSMLGHVDGLRERVRRYVELCGDAGATVDEIEVACDMLHQTASARARELVLLGDLHPTQRRRRTRTQRYARVLVVAQPVQVRYARQEPLPW